MTLAARNSDPNTSHAAAFSARAFAHSHRKLIMKALDGQVLTAREIGDEIGLNIEAVCRRMPELQRMGWAQVLQQGGKDIVRDGCRVWRATVHHSLLEEFF